MAGKIVDRAELLTRAGVARQARRTIVHCHGCFDIVHPGHLRYLEFARRQGDVLVVSLTGDCQIAKGNQRPYIPQELRAESLAALEMVDLVYINPHPTAQELLEDLKPDVYVKGREYEHKADPDFLAERDIVIRQGGRVLFSSGDVVFSSTRLIESIAADSDLEAERLTLLCRRYSIHRESAYAMIEAFCRLRVLVVGDVVLDRYVLCDAANLAGEAPMMSLTRLEERVFVGGAGIVARHAAGLGAATFLLATGGDDDTSAFTRQVLENEGVRAFLIDSRSRLPERTRFLVETTKVLRVEDGASAPLDSRKEREAAEWLQTLEGGFDAVILCDLGYGTITAGLLERLRALLLTRSRIMTADVSGPRGNLLLFKGADLLCPTERELRSTLHDFDSGLSNVAWHAMDQTRARHMLVTLGNKGQVVFDRQTHDPADPQWRSRLRSEYLPSLADRTVDPLGADEALLAAATLSLATGGSLMQAAYFGAAAAAVETARLGNAPIDAAALHRWLAGRIELTSLPRRHPARTLAGTEHTVQT